MYPGHAGDTSGIQNTGLAVLNALHNPSAPVTGIVPFRVGQDVILQQVFEAMRTGGLGSLKKINFTTPPSDVTINASQLPVLGSTPVITVSEATED